MDAAGRSWVVRVQTPVHTNVALPLTILIGGLLLSALVGALLLALGRRQERTEGDRHAGRGALPARLRGLRAWAWRWWAWTTAGCWTSTTRCAP